MFEDMDNVVNTFFAQADEFAQKLRDQDHRQDDFIAEGEILEHEANNTDE